jgi:hypothetical protein
MFLAQIATPDPAVHGALSSVAAQARADFAAIVPIVLGLAVMYFAMKLGWRLVLHAVATADLTYGDSPYLEDGSPDLTWWANRNLEAGTISDDEYDRGVEEGLW